MMAYKQTRDNYNENMPYSHNHVELGDGYEINASLITSPINGHSHDFIAT